MSKKIFLILISIILVSCFVYPFNASAEETNWTLKQKETQDLLGIIRKEPLTKANENLFSESIYGRDFNAPRKTGAVVLVKQVILKNELNYWFKELPKQLSIKFIKTAFKIIPLIYGQDISTILGIIEKLTVEQATNYALNWLTEKEIKISTGELDYSFSSYQGNWQTINIQYIIVYKPINSQQGEIVVEFYSKKPIEPPIGTSPNAFGRKADNLDSNCWPWDWWVENEKQRNNDGKLEPFIVRVKGFVKKNEWNNFIWDNSKKEPIVEIDFDNPVPEIEESDIILSQGEKGLQLGFLREKLETIIEKIQTSSTGIKQETLSFIEKVKSYIGKLLPPSAQISSEEKSGLSSKINLEQFGLSPTQIKETLERLTEEALSLGKTEQVLEEKSVAEFLVETSANKKSSLEELQEKLDEISERADILLADTQSFLSEERYRFSRSRESVTEEIKEKEQEEEKIKKEEEIKEEIEMEEEIKKEKEIKDIKKEIVWCSSLNNQYPSKNKVIFNEIAWMGTTNSSNDEWMELKNISNSPIDLEGWQILDKDRQININITRPGLVATSPGLVVNPNGFFLLERTDDNSVPNISADLIYTGGLNNTNEALYLFDKNCQLQDKVLASPNWPAGSNSSKRTMEMTRLNLVNWQTSKSPDGTPRAENSSGYSAHPVSAGSGGGSYTPSNEPPISVAKLLISEIQIESEKEVKDEFIEIYNPNNNSVSLRGWSIQKAASSGTISKKNFENNDEIPAKGYFLIVNSFASQNLLSLADMKHNSFSIASGNTIFLVANQDYIVFGNEETIKDKVGWGESFSPEGTLAQEPETGQTIGRKWLEESAGYQDTDNNREDFEIQNPTPKTQNQTIIKDTTPPVAESGPDQIVEVNQPVSFNSSSSTDNVGIVSFKWDIDSSDGLNWENPDSISSNPFLKSGYSATGTYTVTLQVSDEAGNTASDTLTVIVALPPKILISEIQIESASSTKEEFVELYNPNSFDVNLSGFSLKKKTSGGTESNLVSAGNFSGTISSSGYFLITPQDKEIGDVHYSGKDYYITKDNTVLLYSKYDNLIDQVESIDHPQNYSFGRKWSTTTGNYEDNFEIQNPTPKNQNESDLTPPETTIISSPPVLTNQTTATFFFSANEENCTFEYKLDDQDWQKSYKSGRSSDFVTSTDEGEHLFQVKAIDPAGNEDPSPAQYNWTIDTTIESPVLFLADSDSISTSTSYTNKRQVKVYITNDEEAMAWFLSETPEKPTTSTPGWLSGKPTTFALSISDSPPSDGKTKTAYLWTKDASGNVSKLGNSASIILDVVAPEIFLDDKPFDPNNQTTSAFSFSSNENCFFEYKFDNEENWQICSEIRQSSDFATFEKFTEGQHLFQVRAIDQAENFSSTSDYSWLIDLTPPFSQIETLASSSTSTAFTIKWSGTDPVSGTNSASGILNYDIQYTTSTEKDWLDLAIATTSTSANFTGQDENTYYFRSRARDKAGNEEDWSEIAEAFCKIEVPKDTQPPLTVLDLKTETGENPGEIKLTWTAPSDNWPPYKASEYIIKYFSEEIIENNWASSTTAAELPTPQDASTSQSFTISGLVNNTIYYFAIKSKDAADNISTISNSTSSETLAVILEISTTTLNFSAFQDGENPQTQFLTIENQGKVEMNWSISTSSNWVLVNPASGVLSANTSTSTEISVDIPGLLAGNYQSTTTVETANAKNSPQNVQINLTIEEPPNQPPIAMFACSPENPYVGQEITFDASESSDPDDDSISFFWNFGDGSSITTISEITTHAFATSGEFSISLIVQDSEGATSSTSTSVKILEKPKIVISEVQINKKEFIELYNFGDEPASTTGWYLSYFSANKNWNEPQRNWQFSTTTSIASQSFYLIGIKDYPEENGNPNSDWQVLTQGENPHPYETGQLSNERGTIGIFFCDPKIATSSTMTLENAIAQAKKCKIDLVGWDGPKVKEGIAITTPEEGESLTRKQDESENYIDTDDNASDFEILSPNPINSKNEIKVALPPAPVKDFEMASSIDNTVILTWSTSTDSDTPTSSISYIIYWSKQGEITTTSLSAITTGNTTTTITTLTIEDLYYDSTYYFGIRAFDGENYSELSTTTPLIIAPEIPQWQMFGNNNQRTFQSPYVGPTTSFIKLSYNITEASQFWTGSAIDQNGTIYVGTLGLLALKQENNELQKKWFYPHQYRILQPPLIGKDGTIYVITYDNKILAISPAGELRWSKEINTSFSNNYDVNLAIANNILYYAAPSTTETFLIAIDKNTGETTWDYPLGLKNENSSASSPTLSLGGTIYISFENTLFAFASTGGPPKWHKIFQTDENYNSSLPCIIPQISVSDETIYFIVKGTSYEQSRCTYPSYYCNNTLYAVKESSTTNATTTLLNEEIKWEYSDRLGDRFILGKQGEIYLNLEQESWVSCDYYKKFYKFMPPGTLTAISPNGWSGKKFNHQILDKNGNIFGEWKVYSNASPILGLILEQEQYWTFPDWFIFSFALSENGILYAPTHHTLYGFSE